MKNVADRILPASGYYAAFCFMLKYCRCCIGIKTALVGLPGVDTCLLYLFVIVNRCKCKHVGINMKNNTGNVIDLQQLKPYR